MKNDQTQTRFTKKRYDATSAIYNIMEWPVEKAGWELTQVEDKAMNGVFRMIRAENPGRATTE